VGFSFSAAEASHGEHQVNMTLIFSDGELENRRSNT
jgi:hypothetical protein